MLDGEGAFRYGGRWNSPGYRVIYCASSRALAALEMLVHFDQHQLLSFYIIVEVEFPEYFIEQADMELLPKNWSKSPVPASVQQWGDLWIDESRSVVLEVPSAVIDGEFSYLLNPNHDDFDQLRISKPQAFKFDQRLLSVRKKRPTKKKRK